MVFFHRDPKRIPTDAGVISPADGIVMDVSKNKAAVFMGLHNVHVNRAPFDGRVKLVLHKDGRHLPAFLGTSSNNEQNLIILETSDGEIEVCQITGAIVRRIVSYVKPGDVVKRGEKIGMIRFGSRVEFTLPRGYNFCVKIGDKVRAGETVVAVKVR